MINVIGVNLPRLPTTIKMNILYCGLFCLVLTIPGCMLAKDVPTEDIFTVNPDGSLNYTPDVNGNILPDFSYAGYKANNEPIPYIQVVREIEPLAGDNTLHIQAAIDAITAGKADENGFYGALLLKAGEYRVSGQIRLASGIVLRGEGQTEEGTKIIATGQDRRSLILAKGKLKFNIDDKRAQKITDNYVPVGARRFSVHDAENFSVGDDILVVRIATQEWISNLGMDKIPARKDGRKITQWTPDKYHLKYERKITAIEGNTITVDVPLVQMMQQKYAGGTVYPISPTGRLSLLGVENVLLVSEYKKGHINSDEDHSWKAIEYRHVENAWISDITAKHFAKSLASIERGSRLITVRDSKNLDPASKITGRRRYSFALAGGQTLFLRCDARNGRHDYLTSSRPPGPNAFVYGKATKTHSDIGPHSRWATGTLFDNIEGGDLNVEDRNNLGTGHGWTGAQQVFWNTIGRGETAVQSPPDAINWSIGHVGKRSNGRWQRPQGVWSSHGHHVEPESLFVQQLIDRIGAERASLIINREEVRAD